MAETAWFTYDDFAARVGDQFRVRLSDEHSLSLSLSEVTTGPDTGGAGPDGTARQQFSLLFRGPEDPRLNQGTWVLDHDKMGEIALFLVPLGADAEGPRYEAVFA